MPGKTYKLKELQEKSSTQIYAIAARYGISKKKREDSKITLGALRRIIFKISKGDLGKNPTVESLKRFKSRKTTQKKKALSKRSKEEIKRYHAKKRKDQSKGKTYYAGTSCTNPPPCPEDAEQFKLISGESCCRKKNH